MIAMTMMVMAIFISVLTIGLIYADGSVVNNPDENTFTLHAAVTSKWLQIVNRSLSFHNLSVPVTFHDLTIKDSRSQYDKMLKAKAKLEKNNIHVVLGGYDDSIAMVTEKLNIPYLSTTEVSKPKLKSTFQMLPTLSDFGTSILAMVNAYKWQKVSLFYDDDRGISIIEQLLTNHDLLVKSWRVDQPETDELPSVKQVRDHLVHMRRAFVQKSIIFCGKENTRKILDQARSLAMLSTPYEWFFYDPGDQLAGVFSDFPDVTVNFTLFGLMNFKTETSMIGTGEDKLKNALSWDAALLLKNSVIHLENFTVQGAREGIQTYIRQVTNIEGMTGHLEFDSFGKRYNYSIILTEVDGFDNYQVAVWLSHTWLLEKQLQFKERIDRGNVTTPFPLRGRKAKVVMILEKPFTMHKRDYQLRQGNDRFEGYAVDLIKEVAKMLSFDYEIYLVHDGNFGSKDQNGEWTGMIGELLSGNATMSVAPLSINSEREEAVDFTKPFMTRYISVLMKLPKSERRYFEFLNPLHHIVWFCTFGAFIVVSIILYMLEKIGTSHNKDYPTISFRESFWFVFGSLLQGSTDASPSTLPGRILTSAWWFFALILISSYTANLAAFLTVKKINAPIKSVTDLASQTKIKYGTVKHSGIMSFFKQTNIEHFAKMWAQMSEVEPQSMVENTTEGFKKVKMGNYAFFWDTTVNNYKTIKDCEFMEIGPHFDPKGFGIGVPPGATYREELSMAILKLSDRGLLHELENKHWGRRNCPDFTKPSADETSELQIENVAGVFFILLGGILFAGIVCGFEHFTKMLHRAAKKQNAPQTEKELESFLRT